jgi:hypothetical protein
MKNSSQCSGFVHKMKIGIRIIHGRKTSDIKKRRKRVSSSFSFMFAEFLER